MSRLEDRLTRCGCDVVGAVVVVDEGAVEDDTVSRSSDEGAPTPESKQIMVIELG